MSHNTRTYIPKARPILKWAGGKSQLLKQYSPYFPHRESINRYFEPFIGSAAVFFHLQPASSFLSDINDQLVEIYQVIQKDVDGLIDLLKGHRNEHGYYYQVRAQNPLELSPAERAARLIYMNKTCFNGLFRVNKKGEFNVPFGRYKNPDICNEVRLHHASEALQGVDLRVIDFEEAVADAQRGDLVYFDPPYVPLNQTSSFTSYYREGFGLVDQERLSKTVHELVSRGANVMLSNSDTPLVRDLYGRRGYQLIEVQARRTINSKADRRGPITELLITNFNSSRTGTSI